MSSLISKYATWNYWRTILFYAVILMLVAIASNLWMTRDQAQGSAPPISGLTLDETNFVKDFKQLSKPVLIYFFADWCPICKMQHSVIESIEDDYDVIGIAMQSGSLKNVQDYVKQEEISFRVVNDESGAISQAYGVTGVPAAFIVDAEGQIQYSTRGYATEAGLRSRLILSQLSE